MLSYKQPITLSLTPCPHRARHALQSTTSDRSHAIGFYCRLTCGGGTFSIELGPSRNTSIHASETECSPSSLTLCLAKRATRSVAVDLRLARLTLRSVDRTTIVTAKVHLATTLPVGPGKKVEPCA